MKSMLLRCVVSGLMVGMTLQVAADAKQFRPWAETTYLSPSMEGPLTAVGIRRCNWGDGTYVESVGTLVGDRRTVLSTGHGVPKVSQLGANRCTFTLFGENGRPLFTSTFARLVAAEPLDSYTGSTDVDRPDWGVGTLTEDAPMQITPIRAICLEIQNVINTKNSFIITFARDKLIGNTRKLVTTKLRFGPYNKLFNVFSHDGTTFSSDSGAPIMTLEGGIPYVLAVHRGSLNHIDFNFAQLLTDSALDLIKDPVFTKNGKLETYNRKRPC